MHIMKSMLFFLKSMLHEDFAEIYKNHQQDAIQKGYFGSQCFRILTACCYTKSPNKNDVRYDHVIVVTESFDHDRVASISCLQKVIHKIEHAHKKTYQNVYIWSDGMGSQFISRYIFKLLASKAP